ncbi:MAG: hypothetical protein AAF391_03345 [Bacteroidota bacterium]
MKKIALIVGILVAVNIVSAQDGPQRTPRERAKVKIEEYKERLQLTEDQIDDLKAMKEKYRPEMEDIRKDESKSRSDKMRAAADVIEKQEEEMASILNEDQLAEWKEIRGEVKDRRHKRRERRREFHRRDN